MDICQIATRASFFFFLKKKIPFIGDFIVDQVLKNVGLGGLWIDQPIKLVVLC